jgi:hypothetical protein
MMPRFSVAVIIDMRKVLGCLNLLASLVIGPYLAIPKALLWWEVMFITREKEFT